MADQKVKINIGTSYNGEGMTRAMGAIDQISKVAGKSSQAIGKLGGALGGLSGDADKAVGAVAGLAGALATGGPIGLAIVGVTTLISTIQSLFGKMEELDKLREKNKKAWEEAATVADDWLKTLKKTKVDEITSANDKLTTSLNKLASAQDRVAASQQGLNEARGNLQIADMSLNGASNEQLAEKRGEMAVERASSDIARKTAALENAKAIEKNTKATLEAAEFVSGKKADWSKYEEAQANTVVAQNQLAASLLNLVKVQKQNEIDIQKAHDEDMKANWEANKGAIDREIEEKKRAQEIKKLEEEIAIRKKDQIDIENELKEAEKQRIQAEKEYADKLKKAQVAATNATWQGWAGNNNIPTNQITGNGINGQNRYGARNNASPRDAAYLARVAAGMERNAASQGFGLSARDRARQAELYAKAGRGTPLSNKELAELKALNDRDPKKRAAKAAEEAKQAAQKLKQAQDAEKQLRKENHDNLASIKAATDQLRGIAPVK